MGIPFGPFLALGSVVMLFVGSHLPRSGDTLRRTAADPGHVTFDRGEGAVTTVEAFILAVMAAIVVAIAVPSYMTIRDRDADSAARSQLRHPARRPDRIASTTAPTPACHPSRWARSTATEISACRVKSVHEKTFCLETTVRGHGRGISSPRRGDLAEAALPFRGVRRPLLTREQGGCYTPPSGRHGSVG